MTPIKVNLDSRSHSQGRGVGYYAEGLVKALKQFDQIEITNSNPDITHYPFFDLFYPTLPLLQQSPVIVTIHDLTPLILADLYPVGIRGKLNFIHQIIALKNTKAIITDSQNSKSDIVRLLKINPNKVHVTPLAADEIFSLEPTNTQIISTKKKYHLPAKFILTVAGGANPNKNLPLLAEVTKDLGLPLVIVGGGLTQGLQYPVHPELRDLMRLKTYHHLILPGFVPTEDLVCIYKLANLYCQPSKYEGFGLPLLQAMMSGCLAVSSDASSLPEIYPTGTITFNPYSYSSLKAALLTAIGLAAKDKSLLIEKQLTRSKDFSWHKTAKATIEVYRQTIQL